MNHGGNTLKNFLNKAEFCLNQLKEGKYSEFTGWMNPEIDETNLKSILADSEHIRENYETLVVIGAGGSHLGAKAIIEALSPKYNRKLEVIFMGNNLSPLDMNETLEYLKTKKFFVNVISKSGGTLEPAVAFSNVQKLMFEIYGENAFDHLIVTTDKLNGELREFANKNNIKSYVIPEDVGGRFSVLTPVGLLPIACAGIDIERLLEGAQRERDITLRVVGVNSALAYSSFRVSNYMKGRKIEIFATYEPRLRYFAEWWKQLFGETEGKDGKGIFPTVANFSSDLHSIGQIIQDGEDSLIETHFVVENYEKDYEMQYDKNDLPLTSKLSSLKMSDLNNKVYQATLDAHFEKGIPCVTLTLNKLNEYELGRKIFLLMMSASLSAMMINVHPFNQPGVETYKKNIKL